MNRLVPPGPLHQSLKSKDAAPTLRVLGVDPGTQCTGWGVVEMQGRALRGLAAGVCRAGRLDSLPERLRLIHEQLEHVLEEHAPSCMAVESLFYAKHPQATIKLGHIRGVVLLLGARQGLPISEYSPALVKRTVAGHGRADKSQVARMVAAMLGLKELPALDATDALAVAITELRAQQVKQPKRISA